MWCLTWRQYCIPLIQEDAHEAGPGVDTSEGHAHQWPAALNLTRLIRLVLLAAMSEAQ